MRINHLDLKLLQKRNRLLINLIIKSMVRIKLISALLLLFFALACNNSQKGKNSEEEKQTEQKVDNQSESEQEVDNQSESEQKVTSSKSANQPMKARFKKYMLGDGGATYIFVDESGKEWELKEHGDTEDTDFAGSLKPNTLYPEFENQWFEVTWDKRKTQHYSTGEGAVTSDKKTPVLLSVKKIDREEPPKAEAPAITFEDLQNAVFFGTEPFWSIKFRNNGMYYQSGPDQEKELYNYMVPSGSETPVKALSEETVQINVWPAKNGPDSYKWHITIRKEPCSDGMSENTYPYSIEINRKDADGSDSEQIGIGCGRITNNLVNIEDIKETKKIKKYTVSEVTHEPGHEFNIELQGTFDFKGHFTINPMSDMLNFHVAENNRPGIEVKIDTFTRPLFTNFNFKNEEEVRTALGEKAMEQIRNDEKVQAHIVFKNYEFGGKIDGYGGARAEFVKINK